MNIGIKYETTKNLTTAEIAKMIRSDIKALVKAGELPAAAYSVRTRSYSGGSSIDVTISGSLPFRSLKIGSRFGRWEAVQTDALNALVAKLNVIVNAYNRQDVDLMTDYFNVRFYSDVRGHTTNREVEYAELQRSGFFGVSAYEVGVPVELLNG